MRAGVKYLLFAQKISMTDKEILDPVFGILKKRRQDKIIIFLLKIIAAII